MTRRPAEKGDVMPHATEPIGVVHLAAEYWPFARTGGLAEAVSGLACFQAAVGHPTTVFVPLYRSVRETGAKLKPLGTPFTVVVGPRQENARLWQLTGAGKGPRVLFVEHHSYFDRAGIYGENGMDYPDNPNRFAFFCLAALQALPQFASERVVLHAHDWHTALAPVFLRSVLQGNPCYDRAGVVLSVHNAGFQGHFPEASLAEVGLPEELYDGRWLEWYGRVNWLKGGLTFCDMATTVSPTHAFELRTEVGGFGLHETFIALGDRLVGILNGIDAALWNPETDQQIPARYALDDMSGKARCKASLQRAWGLPQSARTPVFAMSARLVSQKGLDLILNGRLPHAVEAQFVFLGTGEPRYEAALTALAATAPERVAVEFNFTDRLEHRLLAGADMLLMPSLYEPCGLTQMRAMRYGTIPVARRVGGLSDTIEDAVTGFMFDDYSPAGLEQAVRRAMALYGDPVVWQTHVGEAMTRDFGWAPCAAKYLELYRRALAARPE